MGRRIVVYQVEDKCKYLSITDSGYYCSACIHCDGWEKIEPSDCDKCHRDKCLEGRSEEEIISTLATTLYNKYLNKLPGGSTMLAEAMAIEAFETFLEK